MDTTRLVMGSLTMALLLAAGSAPAAAFSLRDQVPTYAAAGEGAAAAGSNALQCRTDAAALAAWLTPRGRDANGSERYSLSFLADSPCGAFADTCRGLEGEDGAIDGSCTNGATFRVTSLRVGTSAPGFRVAFDLEVRTTVDVNGRSVGLVAAAPLRGVGVDA